MILDPDDEIMDDDNMRAAMEVFFPEIATDDATDLPQIISNIHNNNYNNNSGSSNNPSSSSSSSSTYFINKDAAGPLYESEFLEIWVAFTGSETCRITPMTSIDPSRHLMSTCLENLIPFCRWARDTANQEWIRSKLAYDRSLRPGVRNGLALILIYVFASGQAAASHGDNRTTNITKNYDNNNNHHLNVSDMSHNNNNNVSKKITSQSQVKQQQKQQSLNKNNNSTNNIVIQDNILPVNNEGGNIINEHDDNLKDNSISKSKIDVMIDPSNTNHNVTNLSTNTINNGNSSSNDTILYGNANSNITNKNNSTASSSSSSSSSSSYSQLSMFGTLQSNETGLGIVNKTSLKIYNDPFYYFAFIKACISGLIDAGVIVENERQSTTGNNRDRDNSAAQTVKSRSKKDDKKTGNEEECKAFHIMKRFLVDLLDRRDHIEVRSKIMEILELWQRRHQYIRSSRFTEAAKLCAGPSSSQISGQTIDGYVNVNMNVNMGVPSSIQGVPVPLGHLPHHNHSHAHTHGQTIAPVGVGVGMRHPSQIHPLPHSHGQVPLVGINQVPGQGHSHAHNTMVLPNSNLNVNVNQLNNPNMHYNNSRQLNVNNMNVPIGVQNPMTMSSTMSVLGSVDVNMVKSNDNVPSSSSLMVPGVPVPGSLGQHQHQHQILHVANQINPHASNPSPPTMNGSNGPTSVTETGVTGIGNTLQNQMQVSRNVIPQPGVVTTNTNNTSVPLSVNNGGVVNPNTNPNILLNQMNSNGVAVGVNTNTGLNPYTMMNMPGNVPLGMNNNDLGLSNSREKRMREEEILSKGNKKHVQPFMQSQPFSQKRRVTEDDESNIVGNTMTSVMAGRTPKPLNTSTSNNSIALMGSNQLYTPSSSATTVKSTSASLLQQMSMNGSSPELLLQKQSEQILQQQQQIQQQALELASQHQQRVVMMNILAGTTEQQLQLREHQKELHNLVQKQLMEQIQLAEKVRKQKLVRNSSTGNFNNTNNVGLSGRASPAITNTSTINNNNNNLGTSTPQTNPMSYSMTPDGNVNVNMNLFAIDQGQGQLSEALGVDTITQQTGLGIGIGRGMSMGLHGMHGYTDSHLVSHVHTLGSRVGMPMQLPLSSGLVNQQSLGQGGSIGVLSHGMGMVGDKNSGILNSTSNGSTTALNTLGVSKSHLPRGVPVKCVHFQKVSKGCWHIRRVDIYSIDSFLEGISRIKSLSGGGGLVYAIKLADLLRGVVGTASAIKPTAVFQSRNVGEVEIKSQAAQASGTVQLDDTVMGTVGVGMVNSEGHVEEGVLHEKILTSDEIDAKGKEKGKGKTSTKEGPKEDPHGIVLELAERGIVPVMYKESLGGWSEIRGSVDKFRLKSVTSKEQTSSNLVAKSINIGNSNNNNNNNNNNTSVDSKEEKEIVDNKEEKIAMDIEEREVAVVNEDKVSNGSNMEIIDISDNEKEKEKNHDKDKEMRTNLDLNSNALCYETSLCMGLVFRAVKSPLAVATSVLPPEKATTGEMLDVCTILFPSDLKRGAWAMPWTFGQYLATAVPDAASLIYEIIHVNMNNNNSNNNQSITTSISTSDSSKEGNINMNDLDDSIIKSSDDTSVVIGNGTASVDERESTTTKTTTTVKKSSRPRNNTSTNELKEKEIEKIEDRSSHRASRRPQRSSRNNVKDDVDNIDDDGKDDTHANAIVDDIVTTGTSNIDSSSSKSDDDNNNNNNKTARLAPSTSTNMITNITFNTNVNVIDWKDDAVLSAMAKVKVLYQCHNSYAAKTSIGSQFTSETAEATKCCPERNVVDRSRYIEIGTLANKTTDITGKFRIIPAIFHDLYFEVAEAKSITTINS